jgi:trehalose 6-phosphate synthase/phosphatase
MSLGESSGFAKASAAMRRRRVEHLKSIEGKLIVVSNRLPVSITEEEDGSFSCRMSSGGLVAGLAGLRKTFDFVWVGWPGLHAEGERRRKIEAVLRGQGCLPVWLPETIMNAYYNGYCNAVLWPLFHYISFNEGNQTSPKERQEYWEAYQEANRYFAAVLTELCSEDDTVWVHDYHLMLLPRLLRAALSTIRIGFFLHIPFPSSEIYRMLPERSEILQGVLATNLMGFHTFSYARHFMSCCMRLLGLQTDLSGVSLPDGHFCHAGAFPIGIEPQKFMDAQLQTDTQAKIAELKKQFHGKKIILGVDRLDYIKGIPHKIQAFELFLDTHPEMRGKVVLLQIGVPSREDVEEYQKLSSHVNEMVGRINSKYGTVSFAPIHYINQSVPMSELTALYTLADVLLVTSLRDGMNLVSYEYIACQQERHGVLILSEFTGAAMSLGSALRVNPWDIGAIAQNIYDALNYEAEERKQRHKLLLQYVLANTSSSWGTKFMRNLFGAIDFKVTPDSPSIFGMSPIMPFNDIKGLYQCSSRRVLFLDYDGTLISFKSHPNLAIPPQELTDLLLKLSEDPRNFLCLISGRKREVLEKWFPSQSIGLAAEHGYQFRIPGTSKFENLYNFQENSWKDTVADLFRYYESLTPGSYMEEKHSSLTWHYRSAEPGFGEFQAKEVLNSLSESVSSYPVDIIQGAMNIEVRHTGMGKGVAVSRVLNTLTSAMSDTKLQLPKKLDFEGKVDFVLAVGDDRTDEEMFQALDESRSLIAHTVTCTVGNKSTSAEYHLPSCEQVLSFLRSLTEDA